MVQGRRVLSSRAKKLNREMLTRCEGEGHKGHVVRLVLQ